MRISEAISCQQILGIHVEHLVLFEVFGIHSLSWLYTEIKCTKGTKYLVDRSYFGLVLEVNASVKFRETRHISAFDHKVVLGFVEEGTIGNDE